MAIALPNGNEESRPILPNRNYNLNFATPSISKEIWVLTKTSVPVILAYMLQNSLQTGCVLIVGRLGAEELAASAFAFMFAMVTGWVLALGGSTALDTLCSQSWTASDNPHEVGVLLQRAYLVLLLLFVPVAALWFFVEPVLLFLGQEVGLSQMTQLFLRYLTAGAPAYICFEATKKYLQAQGIMHAGTYVLLICSPLNMGLNYLFVWEWNYGFIGAPIATSIIYWLMFGLLVSYIVFIDGSAGWGGFSRRALQNWGPFLKLVGPGILMVGTEWVAFEIVALAAGHLGTTSLAAQSVIMTTDQVLNTIPFGISIATSNRVGNLLGSAWPVGAKFSANLSAMLAATIGMVIMVIMLFARDSFGYLFSDEESVVDLVSDVLPWVAAFQIADGVAGSCGGSLRGMGNQHLGAIVNLISYYALALPLGIYLAFKHDFGLAGLWIGQCVALFLVGGVEWLIILRINWNREVDKCFERVRAERKDEEGDEEL
ncbi:mate-domain-containing protein [Zychaea mexicana]|uniref:mate-domain-containing protein n=1 Tax=Zychaea mexicana TaxID=64656 RepID=UPI0022FE63C5|nr:mate-domain-containing protein [Zychaea mexicana]KAI9491945.1 mate-domain-containing protein [Zychaea mexicana]